LLPTSSTENKIFAEIAYFCSAQIEATSSLSHPGFGEIGIDIDGFIAILDTFVESIF